jgi:hypothetical protein
VDEPVAFGTSAGDEDQNERFDRVIEEATSVLLKFSIPLYIHGPSQRPVQMGTGFFVRRADEIFLVSAAHVLDHAKTAAMFFYTDSQTIRVLSGSMTRSRSDTTRHKDLVDIGVVRLSGSHLPPYPAVEKFAMDVSYLFPRYLPRAGKNYVFIGFPESKSRLDVRNKTIEATPYAYRNRSLPDAEYGVHSLDPTDHVALPLDLKRGFDPAGKLQHFPKPQGMSGSPIVVLFHDEASDESRVFPVVGVATTYRKREHVVFGTDVALVIEAMDNAV